MASTIFINEQTLTDEEWFNDVNSHVYSQDAFIQSVEASPYKTASGHTTVIPFDDSIPQQAEGEEIITVSITPTSSTSRLRIFAEFDVCGLTNSGIVIAALFQDATSNAIAAANSSGLGVWNSGLSLYHEMAAGTTSEITFKVRIGPTSSQTLYINRGSSVTPIFGGIAAVRMRVEELN